jgi:subtilisin family serine protease
MKNTVLNNVLGLGVILALSTSTLAQTAKYEKGKLYIYDKNSSVISLKENNYVITDAQIAAISRNYNITKIEKPFPTAKTSQLQKTYEITCACDENALMDELTKAAPDKLPLVERIPQAELFMMPNDYQIIDSMLNCGVNIPNYALSRVNAIDAWNITQGDTSIKIAIIDQGFSPAHPDFYNANGSSKVVYWDSLAGAPTHGTFVAGMAAAATDNGVGISGIGFNSNLMFYTGIGNYNKIIEAYQAGAKVINISWGGLGSSNTHHTVIDEAYANGVSIVAAAGNGAGGNTTGYYFPASYDHVISVTSIGPNDNHEHEFLWANGGCVPATLLFQHNDRVDIAAPGYQVISLFPGGAYGFSNGTSFSSPMVAGAIALMLSVNPNLTPDEIENILKCSAYNIDAINPNYAGLLGAGRLDAYKAVLMAQQSLNANPLADIVSNYLCESNQHSVELNIMGGAAPFTINWINSNADTVANGNLLVTSVSDEYTAIVTDNLCKSYVFMHNATVYNQLIVDPINEVIEVCKNSELILGEDILVNGGSGDYEFEWTELVSGEVFNGQNINLVADREMKFSLKVIDVNTLCTEIALYQIKIFDENNPACSLSAISNSGTSQATIKMYPNPASDILNIQFANTESNNYQVAVLNSLGMLVKQIDSEQSEIKISVNDLAAGIYYVKINNGLIEHTEKLVVR